MSSLDTKTARLYAKSLFDSLSQDQLDSYSKALAEFAALWQSSSELREAMESPVVSSSEKYRVLKDLSDQIQSDSTKLSNFLCLLQSNKRLSGISQISAAFDQMLAHLKKLLSIEVTSAFEIDSGERQALESKLRTEHGAMVSVSWQVDPELLGGLRIQSGDKLLDGSIRSSLERLRSELSA